MKIEGTKIRIKSPKLTRSAVSPKSLLELFTKLLDNCAKNRSS